ncbi:short chain dehydrogenase [Caballeronia hypogeia]|uniref:Short chain dehydrogenase n=1 Tax=Caballeronia hypogeia TaxID=1777140 RepID=A0A157ZRL1_9BURK|nr:SDR family oxidoreductase [Caballeronia hypogeia]SAK48135.1 short chain dehydrogenase [Caballeronia hypogeia]
MSDNIRAIVTGHTRGLGAALATSLLDHGAEVLAISRQRNASLVARHPNLQQVELDLADLPGLGEWLSGDTLTRFIGGARRVMLINNAGVLAPVGSLADQEPGAIARAVSVNVAAPLMLSAAVAVAVAAAGANATDTRIVHISSGAARNAYPGWSLYCATKAALDQHARAVALDGNRGLRICSIAPGVVDTDMQAEIRGIELERFPLRERFDALKRDGQLATPEESARKVIDHLLSDRFGEAPTADVRELG